MSNVTHSGRRHESDSNQYCDSFPQTNNLGNHLKTEITGPPTCGIYCTGTICFGYKRNARVTIGLIESRDSDIAFDWLCGINTGQRNGGFWLASVKWWVCRCAWVASSSFSLWYSDSFIDYRFSFRRSKI